MFKVNNGNTRTRCEIRSELTIEKPGRRQWCCSGFFSVNFEHISHLVLVFLLLTMNKELLSGFQAGTNGCIGSSSYFTAWKVPKHGVISGLYFPVFSPNTGKCGPEITLYLDTFHAVIPHKQNLQYVTSSAKIIFAIIFVFLS